MKNVNILKLLKEFVIMTAATFIVAVAVYFFLIPSHTSISSISGLAIVLVNFIPVSISTLTLIINVALLIIGFILCGHDFGYKTVYTTILLPAFIKMFEIVLPNIQSITGDATLDVICYVFVVSIGLGILFNMNASSGGLDIVAKIMNKYLHMDMGKAMSLSGMVVALSSALVYDKKTVVLSILGTYFNGIVIDHFVFGYNIKRRVCIISKDKQEQIKNWILYTLKSGATIYQAEGAYDGVVRDEIITIVDKNEYQKLMKYLEEEDPTAFVTVYNVNEIRYVPKDFSKPHPYNIDIK